MIYYAIASALLSVVLNFTVGTTLSAQASLIFGQALQLALTIPMFALLVRRLHDQNRSGWWGFLLPASMLLSIPRMVLELHGDIHGVIEQNTTPLSIVAGLCGLAILVIWLLPGTVGTNRYGADPRLE